MKRKKENQKTFLSDFGRALSLNQCNIEKACKILGVSIRSYTKWRSESEKFKSITNKILEEERQNLKKINKIKERPFDVLTLEQLQRIQDEKRDFFSNPEVHRKLLENLINLSEKNFLALEYILKNIYHYKTIDTDLEDTGAHVIVYEIPKKGNKNE